jgi:predicted cupin superfamily sugar epimerase
MPVSYNAAMLTVEALRRILGLVPHPVEGEAGHRPQVVVPRDSWQGARLIPGGRYALLGTTVAPGFDYADYETGPRASLLASHPGAKELILALTG